MADRIGPAFIEGVEIWVPDGEVLRHRSGAYGPHTEFARVSARKSFRRGEGLPGEVWSSGKPQVWEELGPHFVRAEVARDSGIEAAVAFPVYAGEALRSVVVLLCGSRKFTSGAVELWSADHETGCLSHSGGYYGNLERFGQLSQKLQFQRGVGLPGQAWQLGRPVLMTDLRRSSSFIRAQLARESGVTAGVAVPLYHGDRVAHVLVLLTTEKDPLASAFEIWLRQRDGFRLDARYSCELDPPAREPPRVVSASDGLFGKLDASEQPVVLSGVAASRLMQNERAPFQLALALPIHDGSGVRAVTVFSS